jgi:tRNA nucleotidyltransferase (CCA-adding enzyme)
VLHRLKDDAIPRPVRELCRVLEDRGHRAWVVGGCVRDLLMGREVSDWDLATSALPKEVKRAFRRTIPTGIAHGTMTVLYEGEAYEVTTLRGEGAYSDGRRPDSVEFVREIEEDLARRDFTVNAIAFDPLTDEIVDPWGGLRDLEAGVIRAVRDPVERFGEDGLRVLRAARFSATLGFELEAATEAAIPFSLETFRKVSPERVHDEWKKTLSTGRPSPAFEVMRRTGILAITAPPLAALDDAAFARTMTRIDRAPPDVELRMAALLLDVDAGAPRAAWADELLRSLRASNQERKRTVHLLEHSPVPSSESLSDPALRRWLSAIGRDAVFDALAIARADGVKTLELRQRVEAELARGVPLSTRELPIGGDDVMATLGSSPGRAIGDILSWLLERVLEDPSLADRERLLALVPEAHRAVTEKSA